MGFPDQQKSWSVPLNVDNMATHDWGIVELTNNGMNLVDGSCV